MAQSIVCRLCVNRCSDYKNLYYPNDRSNELYELTREYFHPKILDMDEAKHLNVLCLDCFRQIYEFHSFQASVLVAQLKLIGDNEFTDEMQDANSLPADQILDHQHIEIKVENECILEPNVEAMYADDTGSQLTLDGEDGATYLSPVKFEDGLEYLNHNGDIEIDAISKDEGYSPGSEETKEESTTFAVEPTYAEAYLAKDLSLLKCLEPTDDQASEIEGESTTSALEPTYAEAHLTNDLSLPTYVAQAEVKPPIADISNVPVKALPENDFGPSKEFKCHLCTSSYSFKHNLKRHINRQHSKKRRNKTRRVSVTRKTCNNDLSLRKGLETTDAQPSSLANDLAVSQTHLTDDLSLPKRLKPSEAQANDLSLLKRLESSEAQANDLSLLKRLEPSEAQTNDLSLLACVAQAVVKPPLADISKVPVNDLPEKQFKCRLCISSYSYKHHLKRHIDHQHSKIPMNTTKRGSLTRKTSADVYDKGDVKVNTAGENYRKLNGFQCTLCDISFTLQGNLKRHMNRLHCKGLAMKAFKCNFCACCYRDAYQLKRHMNTKHLKYVRSIKTRNRKTGSLRKVVPHGLNRKGQLAPIEDNLLPENGPESNTTKNSFPCNLCERSYTLRSNLRRHLVRAHFIKTEKPKIGSATKTKPKDGFKCKLCCRIYTLKYNLQRHLSKHHYESHKTKYECKMCRKKCISQKGLTRHNTVVHHSS